MARRALLLGCTLLLAACSRGGGKEARARLEARDRARAPVPMDWSHPESALLWDADEAARRLGSLEYSAQVTWSVSRAAPAAAAAPAPAPDAAQAPAPAPAAAPEPLRVRATERHQVRQLASGDFQALAEVDPGTWSGAESGREVVYAGGMTYARGRYAPFRERPTDRGRDARRFRDESFRLAGEVAGLFGSLAYEPRGDGSLLGRPARRFGVRLAQAGGSALPAPLAYATAAEGDEDTRRRAQLLEERVPLAVEGELWLDAQSGVPLQVRLRGALGQKSDPRLRTEVDLTARLTGWGDTVPSVAAPQGALPDERKPRGVARALEQAGLRKRGQAQEEEPEDEGAE
ncbi:MAG: hypothetical protein HZB56_16820 [Deltaproteobacteria bacterium]|nr:hypothetical protein [Deltaproteobacteria bacterium]